jgi:hypothetical protein
MRARSHYGLDLRAFSATIGLVRTRINPTECSGGGSADVEVLQA